MATDFTMTKNKRVLCVGVCILNVVHVCQEVPDVTKKTCVSEGYWQRSGNASNNCTVLSFLGTESEFFGVLSSVSAFTFLLEDFEQCGILVSNCPQVNVYQPYSSILSCRPTGTFTIYHTDMGFPILRFHDFKDRINLDNYKWVHFEGRNPWETKHMINMVRRYNQNYLEMNADQKKPITISLELAKPHRDLLSLAIRSDIVFVGRDFALLLGFKEPKECVYGLRELLTTIQLREEKSLNELDLCFHSPHIICPWAEQGVDVLTSDYEHFHIKASFTANVVDTIGAGDTFVAGIIHGLTTLNMELPEAVQFGNRLAIHKIQHRGFECLKLFKKTDTDYRCENTNNCLKIKN